MNKLPYSKYIEQILDYWFKNKTKFDKADFDRWFIESPDDYSVEVYQTMLYSAYELYHNSSPSYELYSRPPPVR